LSTVRVRKSKQNIFAAVAVAVAVAVAIRSQPNEF
jgi:hypothetical protein